MNEARKRRDRKMREIRSSEDDIRRTKHIKSIIEDLEHHGPAGLIHIPVLSNIIGKSIKIWNADSSLNSVIGKERMGPAINIEYHANNLGGIGHWTLMQGKDPDNTQFDLNSCLFSVIGSQTGLNPSELRRWTVLRIKSNLRQLIDWLDKILGLGRTNNGMVLMIGGARYCGTSAKDAKLILDKSQGNRCYGTSALGHPRGHVSYPTTSPPESFGIESAEQYSFYEYKSAFLSQDDQDEAAHLVLRTNNAQFAMERLNQGSIREVLTLTVSYLKDFHRINLNYKGKTFYQGRCTQEIPDIQELVIVLDHHEYFYCDRNADVFVVTFYPKT